MLTTDDKFQINSVVWPGVAKVLEETSELNVNLAKLMATGGDVHYWGGINLRLEIEDEIADSIAALVFLSQENNLDNEKIQNRIDNKLEKYYHWREFEK